MGYGNSSLMSRTKGAMGDLDDEPRNESYKKECSDTEYTPIPILAPRDIDNPDELCRTEEFIVVRHSIRNDEEFVTVSPSKICAIERTPGSMSCIYHELFSRKDHRWEVGAEVYIKIIFNSTEIVAKGMIQSLDPNEIVGGEELGPNWCEVSVQVPIKRVEHLVRRYGLFVTIFDAIGATVAWPCPFVSVRSRGSDSVIPVVFSLIIALLRNKVHLRTQITNDIRNGAESSGGSGGGGDATPQGIHVWIERFTKLKPLAFRSAVTPCRGQKDWFTLMEKLFHVLCCPDNFKTRIAAFKTRGLMH
ncbi:zinc finger, CCHC-type, retrotransposon gag domain protein [Tanacetum coccineum]